MIFDGPSDVKGGGIVMCAIPQSECMWFHVNSIRSDNVLSNHHRGHGSLKMVPLVLDIDLLTPS